MIYQNQKQNGDISSPLVSRIAGGVVSIAIAACMFVIAPVNVANAQGAEEDLEEVTVTGSRRKGRSVTELAVPVDIIGADQLAN